MIRGSEQLISRGDICFIELPDMGNSIQKNKRPCVVISNDMACKYSPVINVVSLTSRMTKKPLPTHKMINPDSANGLLSKSIALCEQPLPVGKDRVIKKIGKVSEIDLLEVLKGVAIEYAMPQQACAM
ncbi:MAG: type II toxin-antitoxin system PemK/MazF family toxin [Peptostreptococcaceae bacterium]